MRFIGRFWRKVATLFTGLLTRSAGGTIHSIEMADTAPAPALLFLRTALAGRPRIRRAPINEALLARANEEIRDASARDRLTDLADRRYLDEHLTRMMAQAARNGSRIGVLAIDLDGFRAANDRLGRNVGDGLIRAAGTRLQRILRQSDFLARTGGDEFAIVCPDVTEGAEMARLAERIIAAMGEPAEIGGHCLTMSCCVGIVISENGDADPDQLLSEADIALYDARTRGPGTVEFFADAMRAQATRRREIVAALGAALEADRIEPFFQPQVSARTGEIAGFEAFARWLHPEKGVLPPGYFLDLAQQSGLGEQIAGVIARKALATLSAWRRQGFDVPRVALNFSISDLRATATIERLIWDVDQAGLAPSDIAIELSGAALVETEGSAVPGNLDRLIEAGCAIEIDDFGIGPAPVASLRRFRISRMKINRSFIAGIHTDPQRETMARAIIGFAAGLGMASAAEGVETAEEWRRLSQLGCDMVQGYGIGKPMSGEECAEWMSTYRGRRALGPQKAVSA